MKTILVSFALLAPQLGCSVPRPVPTLPSGISLDEELVKADEYCAGVQLDMNSRSGLKTVRYISLGTIAVSALVGIGGGYAFFAEGSESSPSSSSLETKGTVALVSTAAVGIATAIFGYTTKEIQARRTGAADVVKTRALIAEAREGLKGNPGQQPNADQLHLPTKVMDGCYQVALDSDQRGQEAVDELLKEIGRQARKERDQRMQLEMRMQLQMRTPAPAAPAATTE